jgi:hypothetical protein
MNKRAPLIIFVIVLSIIGLVALFFWNSIHSSFVAPLSAFMLLLLDFLRAFDQVYIWGVLLFVLILGTITRLGKTKDTGPDFRTVRIKPSSAGRLRFWETQVFLLTRGRIPSRYSIHEVRHLLVAVMGYKLHLDMAEAEQRFKSGELQFPPQYDEFAKLDQETEETEDLLTELTKILVSTLKGKRQQMIQAREKVLTDLILYMEERLEIEHDH